MGVKRRRPPSQATGGISERSTDNHNKSDLILLEEVVAAIEHGNGSRSSGGFAQYTHGAFKERLHQVLFQEEEDDSNSTYALDWLRRPLIQGLLHGGAKMNRKIIPPSTEEDDDIPPSLPILYWLCRWKYLKQVYGWKGQDDFVLLALRSGATVVDQGNHSHPGATNRESILAGVIQYGTVNTLKHLIHTIQIRGVDIRAWVTGEFIMHNLWPKALERACPKILELLLRYIPATERVWMTTILPDCLTPAMEASGEEHHVSAVDFMLQKLNIWCSYHEPDDALPCLCWNIVGAPHVQDYAACILMLIKNGVSCTPMTMEFINRFLFSYSTSSVPRQYAYTIAQLFFGNWIPSKYQHQCIQRKPTKGFKPNHSINVALIENEGEGDVCVICLEDNKKKASKRPFSSSWLNAFDFAGFPIHNSNHTTTLYCGHEFCTKCISEWGASEPEVNTETRTWELGCPICRLPLPREFLSEENRAWFARAGDRRRNTLGLDHHPAGRGPQWLTSTQITIECKARGISVETLEYETYAQELMQQWNRVKQQRRDGPNIMVDLGASETLSPHYVAPKLGPVVVPVVLQGFPVLAGISGASPYTVISPYLVEKLGLVTKKLISNQFQKLVHDDEDNDTGDGAFIPDSPVRKKQTTMAVIDELVVSLVSGESKIDVRLRNAVVEEPSDKDEIHASWRPGVVLGLDFLESAAWTQIAVEVDVAQSIATGDSDMDDYFTKQRFMVFLHGGQNIHRVSDMTLARKTPEELRYYAFNGRTFRVPLLHVQTNIDHADDASVCHELYFSIGHAHASTAASRQRHRFTECEWCCRIFPSMTDAHSTSTWLQRWTRTRKNNTPGMIRCTFCCDMAASTKQYVYYCDEECRRKANEVHRWRHHQYRSTLVSGVYIVLIFLANTLRQQWRSFLLSFAAFFLATILLVRFHLGSTIRELLSTTTPSSLYLAYLHSND